jgi:hypothetical protein
MHLASLLVSTLQYGVTTASLDLLVIRVSIRRRAPPDYIQSTKTTLGWDISRQNSRRTKCWEKSQRLSHFRPSHWHCVLDGARPWAPLLFQTIETESAFVLPFASWWQVRHPVRLFFFGRRVAPPAIPMRRWLAALVQCVACFVAVCSSDHLLRQTALLTNRLAWPCRGEANPISAG